MRRAWSTSQVLVSIGSISRTGPNADTRRMAAYLRHKEFGFLQAQNGSREVRGPDLQMRRCRPARGLFVGAQIEGADRDLPFIPWTTAEVGGEVFVFGGRCGRFMKGTSVR